MNPKVRVSAKLNTEESPQYTVYTEAPVSLPYSSWLMDTYIKQDMNTCGIFNNWPNSLNLSLMIPCLAAMMAIASSLLKGTRKARAMVPTAAIPAQMTDVHSRWIEL